MKILRNGSYIFIGITYFYLVYYYFGVPQVLEYGKTLYLDGTGLGIISGIIAFFTTFGIVTIGERIFFKGVQKITKKTESQFDDLAVDILCSSLHVVKYILAFYIGWKFIDVPDSYEIIADKVFSISLLVVLLLFITKFINLAFNQKFIDESKMKSESKALMPSVRRIIISVVWIVGIITIISNLGYDVTALIAGAGIGGIAIALAAQKSIGNMFGAMTILMNKPFTIGDYVTINGHTGTVKYIGLSYITLIHQQGHSVMIPNDNIISTNIENQTRRSYRRADFDLGLVYETSLADMEKGVKIIESILESYVKEKKLQSYRVNFEAFGDFSLNIHTTYFSNTNDYTDFVKEKEEINLEIKEDFAKAKLEMAFPTSEMIIKKGDL